LSEDIGEETAKVPPVPVHSREIEELIWNLLYDRERH
jgi:hypothetical protein